MPFAFCLACAFPLSAQSPNALIVGHVIDGTTGRPISGVMVSLQVPGSAVRAGGPASPLPVMTDDSGGFVFSGLGPGNYGITAARGGYKDGAYGRLRPDGLPTWVPVAEGARIGDLKIRIWKLGAITGTVTDESGEPVVGVSVRAMRSAFLAGRRRLVTEKTSATDDRGMYRIGGLVPGEYIVVVPSIQTTLPADIAAEAAGPSQSSEVASALRGLRPMIGTRDIGTSVGPFVLQSGGPESGARANVARPDAALAIYPTTYNGDVTVATQAPSITLGSGETRSGGDIHLRTTLAWRVSGRLVGPDGTVALQQLRLYPTLAGEEISTAQGLETASALSDRSGAFTFLGVPPGQYTLRANNNPDTRPRTANPALAESAWWLVEPVTVGNQNATITASWRAAFTLNGRVVFDGPNPPAGDRFSRFPILIESANETQIAGQSRPATTQPDLTFTTAPIPAGRYLIRIGGTPTGWALRSVMAEGKDISDFGLDMKGPVADVVMTFTDRVTSLSGSVTTAQGVADESATALVFSVDPATWQDFGLNPRRLKSTRVEPDGMYRFPDLPPGDYFLIAIPEEQAGFWREPARLTTLSRLATRIHLVEGQKLTQELRTVTVR